MTAGDADMTTDDPTPKRPRISMQAANGAAGPVAALSVPAVGDHIDAEGLLPALQQLLGAYQVEYWSALEQLRAVHSAADAAGQQMVPGSTSEGSLRQLWEASRATGVAGGGGAGAEQQGAPSAAVNGLVPHQQQAAYGDSRCGYASTTSQQQQQQLPSLGEVEQLLLQLPRGGRNAGAASAEQQAAWRARFASSAAAVAGLEQLASAATLQFMDAQGGLACLCGQQGRWLVRRSAVSIGRSTDTKGEVDIDLSLTTPAAAAAAAGPAAGAGEGKATAAPAAGNAAAAEGAAAAGDAAAAVPSETPAAAAAKPPTAVGDAAAPTPAAAPAAADRAPVAAADTAAPAAPAPSRAACKQVSRLQAQLLLTAEGTWSITNTGRAPMAVNGQQLPRGACVMLPHLSLLEVGGMSLLFMVNSLAVQRAVGRSTHLTM